MEDTAPVGNHPATRRRRRWPWLLAAIVFLIGFLALGTWQVQRLFWKHDLVARVDARIHADPVPAPGRSEWRQVARDSHEYLRVDVEGQFLHQHEALVQATTALGAGYWVLTPIQFADGTLIWVNRGFVPPAARKPEQRGVPSPQSEVRVTGLLRITEPEGAFLRSNDPVADRWHSRDVAALTEARGLPVDDVAPYFVDAGKDGDTPGPSGSWPVPGLTVVKFSDNHLVYALTWYGLAIGLVAALVWARRQERHETAQDGPSR